MDALRLIDRLDDMVRDAAPARLGGGVRLDRQEALQLLDEMRAIVPEEIGQARWIVKARAEMLSEAKLEAERMLEDARKERQRLVDGDELASHAEQRAAKILEMAQSRAKQIRLGAEGYADEILGSLENGLGKMAAVERVAHIG